MRVCECCQCHGRLVGRPGQASIHSESAASDSALTTPLKADQSLLGRPAALRISATDMAAEAPACATLWSSSMLDTVAPCEVTKASDSVSSPRRLRTMGRELSGQKVGRFAPERGGVSEWRAEGERCHSTHFLRKARRVFSRVEPGRPRSQASLHVQPSVVMSPAEITPAWSRRRPSLRSATERRSGARRWSEAVERGSGDGQDGNSTKPDAAGECERRWPSGAVFTLLGSSSHA